MVAFKSLAEKPTSPGLNFYSVSFFYIMRCDEKRPIANEFSMIQDCPYSEQTVMHTQQAVRLMSQFAV